MYLAIDYGRKRIGVAVGEVIPKPLLVLDAKKPQVELISKLKEIAEKEGIKGVVFGLPEKDNRDQNGLNAEIIKFSDGISKALKVPVYFEPEQFTSTEAERILQNNKISLRGNKEKIDKLSAVLILEQFLERKKGEK